MRTTVSTKGQIVLPAQMRREDGIEPGDELEIERLDRGEYRLVRLQPARSRGVVSWLLSCPDKGYFVPIASQSTDELVPPHLEGPRRRRAAR